MRDAFPKVPRPLEVEPAQAQARLFEALTRSLLGLAAHGPLLLCLDDLHWADPATIGWLAAQPNRLAGSNVCILATYRSADAGALADLTRAFARAGLLEEVPLSRLTEAAVGRILKQLPQRLVDPQPLATRVHHATGGNAFFVLETVRALLEVGGLADPPDELPLAPTVQAAIRRRLSRLSPVGRQVLETAAVLAADLGFDLIRQAAGRSDQEVAEGLDELVGRQLLTDGGTHRFSHDLVRQVTYDEIRPWRRRILHRRAAEAVGAARHPHEVLPWAAMAGHYDRAGDAADALRCYGQAAQAAQRLYAHQEAIGHLERALALARALPAPPATRALLHELLGDSLMARGQHEAAEGAYRAALTCLPLEERLARAVVQRKISDTFRDRLLLPEAEAACAQAATTMGPPAADWPAAWHHAWLEIQLSLMSVLYFLGDFSRLADLADGIGPVVASAGTQAHRADFRFRLTELAVRQEHFTLSPATVDLFRAGLAAAQETGDLARVAWAQFGMGFSLLWSGDVDSAKQALLAALDGCEETGITHSRLVTLVYLACCYRFRDAVDAARAAVEKSLATAAEVDMPICEGVTHANLAWLRWRDGMTDGAQAEAKQALALWGDYPYPFRWLANWVLLAVHEERREPAGAVEQAQAILHPSQRRQPGNLPAVLEAAVRAWRDGKPDETRTALQRAIELAQAEGYL